RRSPSCATRSRSLSPTTASTRCRQCFVTSSPITTIRTNRISASLRMDSYDNREWDNRSKWIRNDLAVLEAYRTPDSRRFDQRSDGQRTRSGIYREGRFPGASQKRFPRREIAYGRREEYRAAFGR